MSALIEILRALVRDELRALRLGDVAKVTSVFPHADGDEHNFECSVKLRESDLELRKVPMCAPHLGMASAPKVGDLVLLTYVGGDPNRPIVVGRLYSDKVNPPVHEEDEWWLKVPWDGETSFSLRKDGAVVVETGKTKVSVLKDGNVEVEGEADLTLTLKGNATVKADGNVEITCADATVKASGNIKLGDSGGGVITTESHKCYVTGAPLVGSKTVTAKG